MKPRPPLRERSAVEQTTIAALDAELATLNDAFERHGTPNRARAAEVVQMLDKLRPEWRGLQFQRPLTRRLDEAADNFFNSF